MSNQPTVVWSEIPVRDLDKATQFYTNVFGWTMSRDDSGPNAMVNFDANMAGIGGHLYQGEPANGNGPTLHLAVPETVEAAAALVFDNGGAVMGPVIEILPGRFQYATDPDGNSIGLFEPKVA